MRLTLSILALACAAAHAQVTYIDLNSLDPLADPAASDRFYVDDVSDLSESAEGTGKHILWSTIVGAVEDDMSLSNASGIVTGLFGFSAGVPTDVDTLTEVDALLGLTSGGTAIVTKVDSSQTTNQLTLWNASGNLNESGIDTNGSGVLTSPDIVLGTPDPGADFIVLWDDSDDDMEGALIGSGLSYDGTTLSATGGGTTLTIEDEGVQVGDADIALLDFEDGYFVVTEPTDTEIGITLNAGPGPQVVTLHNGSQTTGNLMAIQADGDINDSGYSAADLLDLTNATGTLAEANGGWGVDVSGLDDGLVVIDTGAVAIADVFAELCAALGITGTQDNTTVLYGDGVLRVPATGGLGTNLSSSSNNLTTDNTAIVLGDSSTGESITLTFSGNTVTITSTTGVATMDLSALTLLLGGLDVTSLSADEFTPETGTDPDLDTAGQISTDTDDHVLRGYDGTNQFAYGKKIHQIDVTVVAPNDLADAARDAFWTWSNQSGLSFVVTGWVAVSDTDDTSVNIEVVDSDATSNNATVDAVEITTGSGPYVDSDTTITAGTIAAGRMIVLDFDDTDAPGLVKLTLYGYYDADVD